jgi:hypothetical protein
MKTKVNDFSGMNIYAGIDVHKKSWSVTILVDEQEHRTFNQPPSAEVLYKYLNKHFSGASLCCGYFFSPLVCLLCPFAHEEFL